MNTNFPPEVRAMMEEAMRFALTGKGNPKILDKITEEAERIRAQVLKKHGVLNIGVPAIRAFRNGKA